MPALSNLKHISGSLKTCTIRKTIERKAEPCLYTAFSRMPWAVNLPPAPHGTPTPTAPDTHISTMLQKEGFLAFSPRDSPAA